MASATLQNSKFFMRLLVNKSIQGIPCVNHLSRKFTLTHNQQIINTSPINIVPRFGIKQLNNYSCNLQSNYQTKKNILKSTSDNNYKCYNEKRFLTTNKRKKEVVEEEFEEEEFEEEEEEEFEEEEEEEFEEEEEEEFEEEEEEEEDDKQRRRKKSDSNSKVKPQLTPEKLQLLNPKSQKRYKQSQSMMRYEQERKMLLERLKEMREKTKSSKPKEPSIRQLQLAEKLRRVLQTMLYGGVNRTFNYLTYQTGFTIFDVRMSPDLRVAKIFWGSSFGDASLVERMLSNSSKKLRFELTQKMNLSISPQLFFKRVVGPVKPNPITKKKK